MKQRLDRERKQATTAQLEMDRYLRDSLYEPLDVDQYNPADWWKVRLKLTLTRALLMQSRLVIC